MKILAIVERASAYVGVSLILLLSFMVVADIGYRAIIGRSLLGAYQLSELLMVGIVFLGLSYTQSLNRHVSVDLVTKRMKPRLRLVCHILVAALGALIFAIVVWKGGSLAIDSLVNRETTYGDLRVSIFPAKAVLVFGSGLLCIRFIMGLIQSSRALLSPHGHSNL